MTCLARGGKGGVESPLERVLRTELTPFLTALGGTGGVIYTIQILIHKHCYRKRKEQVQCCEGKVSHTLGRRWLI